MFTVSHQLPSFGSCSIICQQSKKSWLYSYWKKPKTMMSLHEGTKHYCDPIFALTFAIKTHKDPIFEHGFKLRKYMYNVELKWKIVQFIRSLSQNKLFLVIVVQNKRRRVQFAVRNIKWTVFKAISTNGTFMG